MALPTFQQNPLMYISLGVVVLYFADALSGGRVRTVLGFATQRERKVMEDRYIEIGGDMKRINEVIPAFHQTISTPNGSTTIQKYKLLGDNRRVIGIFEDRELDIPISGIVDGTVCVIRPRKDVLKMLEEQIKRYQIQVATANAQRNSAWQSTFDFNTKLFSEIGKYRKDMGSSFMPMNFRGQGSNFQSSTDFGGDEHA